MFRSISRVRLVFLTLALVVALIHPTPAAAQVNLSLEFSAASGPVQPGQLVMLLFRVTNPASEEVLAPTITITLPPWTAFEPFGSDAHCQLVESEVGSLPGHSRVVCAFERIPGVQGSQPEVLNFELAVRIHPMVLAGSPLAFDAYLAAENTDPQPGDNSASLVLVTQAPETYLNFINMVLSAQPGGSQPQPGVIYVNIQATGTNDGTSWDNAYTDLQSALNAANPERYGPLEIWVARGTYKTSPNSARTATFTLKKGVAIYGGFSGGEESREERSPKGETTLTVLSGEIGNPAVTSDNSFHVVTGRDVDSTAILDGFTIRDGYGDSGNPVVSSHLGGGICLINASPVLRQLVLYNNQASGGGAGLYIENGSPLLHEIEFVYNRTNGNGGGLLVSNGSLQIQYASFSSNQAARGGALAGQAGANLTLTNSMLRSNTANFGGALYSDGSTALLTNLSLNRNLTREAASGALHLKDSSATVQNSILWGDLAGATNPGVEVFSEGSGTITLRYSIVQGQADDPAASLWGSADPRFSLVAGGNLQIVPGSPAVDAGNEEYLGSDIHLDLNHHPRSSGARVDLGAYESSNQSPVLHPEPVSLPGLVEGALSENNPGLPVADLLGGRVTDPDANSLLGMAVIAADNSAGAWQYSTDAGVTWTDVGAVEETAALVLGARPGDRLRYQPSERMNGQATLTLRAWDRSDRYTPGSRGVNARVFADESLLPYSQNTLVVDQQVQGVTDVGLVIETKQRMVKPGEHIVLAVTASNPEPQTIPAAVFTLRLPDGAVFVAEESEAGCQASGSTVVCSLAGLPSVGRLGFSIVVLFEEATAPLASKEFSIELATAHIDPNLANNRAVVMITLIPEVSVQYMPGVFR